MYQILRLNHDYRFEPSISRLGDHSTSHFTTRPSKFGMGKNHDSSQSSRLLSAKNLYELLVIIINAMCNIRKKLFDGFDTLLLTIYGFVWLFLLMVHCWITEQLIILLSWLILNVKKINITYLLTYLLTFGMNFGVPIIIII